jgi:hypothetical protein
LILDQGQNSKDRSGKAVDRYGYPIFRTNHGVNAAFGARSGFALDQLICSEVRVPVAINGAKRSP